MINPRTLFGRRWWKATLLVLFAVAVMVRLGIWQLDRLEQRRAFNARVQAQLDQPLLDLNAALQSGESESELAGMEYREVQVTGEYDPAGEVVLRNQVWENLPGVHLLTPLRIEGSDQLVLVNRGWVPFEDFTNQNLDQYGEPGRVTVKGVIRASDNRSGRSSAAAANGTAWTFANLPEIGQHLSYSILPIYIQQSPDPAWTSLPRRSEVELELTEGPHLGYAIQWFLFAAILAIGYPFYIRKAEDSGTKSKKSSSAFVKTVPPNVEPGNHHLGQPKP